MLMSNNNYGGRREGAGRPPKIEKVRLNMWVTPEAHSTLKRLAKEKHLSMSDLLGILIRRED